MLDRNRFSPILLVPCVGLLCLAACEFPELVERCDCPRPGLEGLSQEEFEELLRQSVETGLVEEGTREYREISKSIRDSRWPYRYFGDDWRDLGYAAEDLWLEPLSALSQGCPFEIHRRICFHVEPCRMPSTIETGPFKEILAVKNDDLGITTSQHESGGWYTESERRSLRQGECEEYVDVHPGLLAGAGWDVRVTWTGDGVPECGGSELSPGAGDVDVGENDSRALQVSVGCYCGDHGSLDIRLSTAPEFDRASRVVTWDIEFDWVECDGNPPESREVQERLAVIRSTDGEAIEEAEATLELMMGGSLKRRFYAGRLEPGTYELSIILTGDMVDCDCSEPEALLRNNRAAVTFTIP